MMHGADELVDRVTGLLAPKFARKPVQTDVFPDECHVKWQPQHKLAAYERSIDWFRFRLQGYEDSSEQKQVQDPRWRAMREGQCRVLAGADAPWYCRD